MSSVEKVIEALRASGLVGCGCCAESAAYYDQDECPVDDGWKDHSYYGECLHADDRTTSIAKVAVAALEEEVGMAEAIAELTDYGPEGCI